MAVLPSLCRLPLPTEGIKRPLSHLDTVTTIDVNIPAFVICKTVPYDVRLWLQEFVDANPEFINSLENVPNFNVWTDIKGLFKLTFDTKSPGTCVARVNDKAWTLNLRRKREDLDDDKLFFVHERFELLQESADLWSKQIHIRDLKCVLARFEIVADGRSYWCNEAEETTVFPIIAYGIRASTAVLPTSLTWHQDRQRRGALLNFIRSMGSEGASTEVLIPLKGRELPYDGISDSALGIRCDPFPKDRTVVFNGAWYHRAPHNGGAREFMQVDLHHEESNIRLVNAFQKFHSL